MNFWQVTIWIAGGAVVIVVIRMLWVAMFEKPDQPSSTSPSQSEPATEQYDDTGDTWIEIDIEPLFPSSESVIDLTGEQERESRP